MTAEREEHLRWLSRQVGNDNLREAFALVDELRKSQCSWVKMPEHAQCCRVKGHDGEHDYGMRA